MSEGAQEREILAASEGASAAHERDEEEEGNARHVYPSAAMTAAFAASIVKRQSACIARFALRSKPMSLEMSNILRGSESNCELRIHGKWNGK